MKDTLITVDTIGNDIVFCPKCNSTSSIEVAAHFSAFDVIICGDCGHAWTEEVRR